MAETMRAQDSLWLNLDAPENRLIVTSVLWTERPVDVARLREVVADRLLARFPVYLRRPVRGRLPGVAAQMGGRSRVPPRPASARA
ncbi:hypothetical protein FPZ12_017975 [Amycolatopsis acidicola]|uniref:Uncharacterized protein n=1 Tax=Amycolatopsis acidicola TaxID=2596893 RepID=A0A5N0V2J4_9PSEU|nr:hypothetical protein [Amycolatopsis acidicola]KAA9160235.1 hypothetical protein FPZ12_017975 [Amycolatopsis acidicola]